MLPSGERAEGVVGIGDAALAVVADDYVALGLEQAAGALLGFLELPVAIGGLLGAAPEIGELGAHHAQPGDEQTQPAAGSTKQRRGADCEHVRVVFSGLALHPRDEAEGGAEAHRQQHEGAHDEGQHVPAQRPEQLHGAIAKALAERGLHVPPSPRPSERVQVRGEAGARGGNPAISFAGILRAEPLPLSCGLLRQSGQHPRQAPERLMQA
jgi:hypothetical protein